MKNLRKWRVAHIANDASVERQFVSDFENAYKTNGQPSGMAMFSHTDSVGKLFAISITPESVHYCPFSANWDERDSPPNFGFAGWVAGDERLK